MDIDLLSKMVKELILDNDRVVLPGLGSFVAEIVPSTFSDKGYTINPPYRRLFFRSKPDEGEMLIRFYAESNNVEPDLAERIIRDFVSELKEVLHSRKTVVFPGLGRLRATKENNVFFVADEDLDIYPAGFGLEPISLKAHEEAPQEVSAAVEDVPEDIVEEPIDLEIEDDFVPDGWTEEDVKEEAVEESVTDIPEEPASDIPEESVVEMEPIEEYEDIEEYEQIAEQDAVTEPELATEPENETIPVAESEAEVETATEVFTESEPVVEPEPTEEIQEPAPESSEPSPEPSVHSSKPVPAPKEEPWKKPLMIAGIVIACLVALLLIYMLVMRIFPDFLNGVLYTPEELEIINFK